MLSSMLFYRHLSVSSSGGPRSTREAPVTRALRDVVFVDGVRTPFGKAGEKGMYTQTRADDLVINCIRELLRRHPHRNQISK